MPFPQPRTFHGRQLVFGQALLDASRPIPDGVIGPDGRPSVRRFNVYRNNVVAGQVSTLCDAYPATVKLVGEEFFHAMARDYVVTHSPISPMMFDYGSDFPDFIDAFPPASGLPYLGDVARIERAWVEAYHSAESLPLSASCLKDILANDLRFLSLQLHPSTRILQSRFPALSIWRMNTESNEGQTIHLDDGPEEVLVVRPDADVHVYPLPKGGARFFKALLQGASMVDAADQAFESDDPFDLVAHMAMLFEAQLVVGTRTTQDNPHPSGVQHG